MTTALRTHECPSRRTQPPPTGRTRLGAGQSRPARAVRHPADPAGAHGRPDPGAATRRRVRPRHRSRVTRMAAAVAARAVAAARLDRRAAARAAVRQLRPAGAVRRCRTWWGAYPSSGSATCWSIWRATSSWSTSCRSSTPHSRSSELTALDVLSALRPRMHGLPRLRRALALADPRSESFWESVLRLVHVLAASPTSSPSTGSTRPGPSAATCGWSAAAGSWSTTAPSTARQPATGVTFGGTRRSGASGGSAIPYVAGDIVSNPGRILRDSEAALGLRHEPARLRSLARVRQAVDADRCRVGHGWSAGWRSYVLAAERPDRD